MRNQMVDVLDYLRRLVSAVFLCPVAVAFWVMFGMAGFNLTDLFVMCGGFAQSMAAMNPGDKGVLLFQIIAGWGSLAFLFLLLTFSFNPPKFRYELKRKGNQQMVNVSQ